MLALSPAPEQPSTQRMENLQVMLSHSQAHPGTIPHGLEKQSLGLWNTFGKLSLPWHLNGPGRNRAEEAESRAPGAGMAPAAASPRGACGNVLCSGAAVPWDPDSAQHHLPPEQIN